MMNINWSFVHTNSRDSIVLNQQLNIFYKKFCALFLSFLFVSLFSHKTYSSYVCYNSCKYWCSFRNNEKLIQSVNDNAIYESWISSFFSLFFLLRQNKKHNRTCDIFVEYFFSSSKYSIWIALLNVFFFHSDLCFLFKHSHLSNFHIKWIRQYIRSVFVYCLLTVSPSIYFWLNVFNTTINFNLLFFCNSNKAFNMLNLK